MGTPGSPSSPCSVSAAILFRQVVTTQQQAATDLSSDSSIQLSGLISNASVVAAPSSQGHFVVIQLVLFHLLKIETFIPNGCKTPNIKISSITVKTGMYEQHQFYLNVFFSSVIFTFRKIYFLVFSTIFQRIFFLPAKRTNIDIWGSACSLTSPAEKFRFIKSTLQNIIHKLELLSPFTYFEGTEKIKLFHPERLLQMRLQHYFYSVEYSLKTKSFACSESAAWCIR